MILYSLIAAAVSAQIAAFLVAVSYALGAPVEWGFTARTAITWGALWPITVGALVYRWRRA